MNKPQITVKGIRDILVIELGSGEWESAEDSLIEHIQSQSSFFKGATVALKLGDRALNRDDIKKLQDKLAEHDVRLSTLLGTSPDTIREARRMELDTTLPEGASPSAQDELADLPPIDSQELGSAGVLVKNTIRSGRIVKHAGHVLVIGDVNPGAQIIAGGDILVWGRLRGTVHAGAGGDDSVLVCALDLRPTQLRIANFVAIAPDEGKARPKPEFAFVRDGQIVAQEWGI